MSFPISFPSGAGWRQEARLLVLHAPLGADVLLAETAHIEECLGPVAEHAGFRLDLTALCADAFLPLSALLGEPVRLDLRTALPGASSRPFHGQVTRVVREGADGGFARYRLTVEPWLAFLGINQDSYLFQDKSVIEIVDELFSDWRGQGRLMVDWRWQLADPAIYPKRGMSTQYRESDLAFVRRLLAEEGLFCWFEHAAGEGDDLGRHTLVIADHNGAFGRNAQPRVRFTQSGPTLDEDSLDRWHGIRQLDTTDTAALSWDYRSRSLRPQAAVSAIEHGDAPRAVACHDPGQYAWQTSAQGERMIGNQRQAIDARMKQFQGEGTLRHAAPGTVFELADHPEHDRDPADQREFLITAVTHQARNNLSRITGGGSALAGADESLPTVDFYRNALTALRAHIPWRPLLTDVHGRAIHPRPTAHGPRPTAHGPRPTAHGPRPTAHGPHTAIVVGDDRPTHTDRDLRVRVQFPWQRGSRSASRQAHPTGSDNAPADQRLGVWLRVLTPVAGANWGGHFTPRPGQEVLVSFEHGNIDRPVITGALYNGRGQSDAQGNQIAGTTANATANAPAFFAGEQDKTHAHHASLSGLKTQQLSHSQDGGGGSNQLVFDDTPGEGRIELSTSEHDSRLQLGHLKEQADNARRADRGHGGELATQGSLALRAGSGLLLSADARPNAAGHHLVRGTCLESPFLVCSR